MKKIRSWALLGALALVACPVVAHHAAEGIVDEEIYAMIDEMVADTPHAALVLEDLGGGMTMLSIETRVPDLETMVGAGLLDSAAMLDGAVTMSVDFTGGRDITVTILQDESGMTTDKALDHTESRTLGDIKAMYR